jgi:hypothetical protein
MTQLTQTEEAERRKRVRRTTLVVSLIAFGFYLAFIIMEVVRASA